VGGTDPCDRHLARVVDDVVNFDLFRCRARVLDLLRQTRVHRIEQSARHCLESSTWAKTVPFTDRLPNGAHTAFAERLDEKLRAIIQVQSAVAVDVKAMHPLDRFL